MASFNTYQSSANTMACTNVWPTNTVLLEAAKAKMPQHAEQLDDLVALARIGMAHKLELENEIGTWHLIHELEYEDSTEWPTNFVIFRCVVNSSEPYKKEALQRLWDLVTMCLEGKKKLDAMIVEILDGTFDGVAYGATPVAAVAAVAAPMAAPVADEHDYERHGHFTAEDIAEMQKEREEEARNPRPPRRYSLHALQRLCGLMPPKELEASAWTEEDYQEHCAPLGQQVDPWADMSEEDWADYQKHCEEDERNQPWCSNCHPDSGCDGDHGDEMRGGFLLRKGPAPSPLTISTIQQGAAAYAEEVDQWAKDLARLVAESRALREAPLTAFAPFDLGDDDVPMVDIEDA